MEEKRIKVEVLAGGMAAKIRVAAGAAGTRSDVDQAMARANVRYGIDATALALIARQISDPAFTATDALIAQGTAPTRGTDGRTEMVIDAGDDAGETRTDGTVDFRERHAITNVYTGQRLATHHPAEPGTPGTTVTGTRLPAAPVASGRPTLGKGVAWEDTVHVTTRRDGVLIHVIDPVTESVTDLDVSDLYTHEGDVDYRSGNLHVNGTARVTGSVQTNFAVTATGDVIVDGQLVRASVDAGVNFRLGGGVSGHCAGGVRAVGDVCCHHASDTHLVAGCTLVIGDHAVNSQLQARHIRAVDGRGKLAGGAARAVHSIHVNEAGSGGDTQTLLSVGLPLGEIAALRRAQRDHDRLRRGAVKQSGRVRTGERIKGGKLGREAARRSRALTEAKRAVRRRQQELLSTAEIVIAGRGHPGVDLHIGAYQLRLAEMTGPGRYVFSRTSGTIERQALQ